MRRKGAVYWTLVCALAASPPGAANALGLRSPVKETVVTGVEPGESRRVRLEISNAGREPVELELKGSPPEEGGLKDGYEPGGAWLRVDRDKRRLGGGETAFGEAVLVIPRDRRLRGGRYQLSWTGEAREGAGPPVRLSSRLLVHVAPQPQDPEPLLGPPESWRLVSEEGTRLKVSNLGGESVRLRVRVVEADEDDAPPGEGWQRAPNPGFLAAKTRTLRVRPGKVGEARFELRVPDQDRYRGRKWVFVVSVDDGKASARYRLLVTTPSRGAGRSGL